MTYYKQQYESYYSGLRGKVKGSYDSNYSLNDSTGYIPISSNNLIKKKQKNWMEEIIHIFIVQLVISVMLLGGAFTLKYMNNEYSKQILTISKKAISENLDYQKTYSDFLAFGEKVKETISTQLTK